MHQTGCVFCTEHDGDVTYEHITEAFLQINTWIIQKYQSISQECMSLVTSVHSLQTGRKRSDTPLLMRVLRNNEEVNKFILTENLIDTLLRKRSSESKHRSEMLTSFKDCLQTYTDSLQAGEEVKNNHHQTVNDGVGQTRAEPCPTPDKICDSIPVQLEIPANCFVNMHQSPPSVNETSSYGDQRLDVTLEGGVVVKSEPMKDAVACSDLNADGLDTSNAAISLGAVNVNSISAESNDSFSCEVCSFQFSRKCLLDVHTSTHHQKTTESYSNQEQYLVNRRQRRVLPKSNQDPDYSSNGSLHRCHVCSKTFKSIGSLKYHETIHTGEKPFSCRICGKSFRLKGSLQTHLGVHTRERPFGCRVCKKRFSTKSNLRTHLRTHTNERPYACKFCPKRYRQNVSLVRHMQTHAINYGNESHNNIIEASELTVGGDSSRLEVVDDDIRVENFSPIPLPNF